MNFFVIFCSLALPVFALKGENICINCKHFTKDFFNSNRFGKCKLFPRETNSNIYLVDGKSNPQTDNYYCSTARMSDDMCGIKGRLFEKKAVN